MSVPAARPASASRRSGTRAGAGRSAACSPGGGAARRPRSPHGWSSSGSPGGGWRRPRRASGRPRPLQLGHGERCPAAQLVLRASSGQIASGPAAERDVATMMRAAITPCCPCARSPSAAWQYGLGGGPPVRPPPRNGEPPRLGGGGRGRRRARLRVGVGAGAPRACLPRRERQPPRRVGTTRRSRRTSRCRRPRRAVPPGGPHDARPARHARLQHRSAPPVRHGAGRGHASTALRRARRARDRRSWLRAEWDAVGLDFDDPRRPGRRRDRRVSSTLGRRRWSSTTGRFFDFGPTAFEPKPVQQPLPLHVG